MPISLHLEALDKLIFDKNNVKTSYGYNVHDKENKKRSGAGKVCKSLFNALFTQYAAQAKTLHLIYY